VSTGKGSRPGPERLANTGTPRLLDRASDPDQAVPVVEPVPDVEPVLVPEVELDVELGLEVVVLVAGIGITGSLPAKINLTLLSIWSRDDWIADWTAAS